MSTDMKSTLADSHPLAAVNKIFRDNGINNLDDLNQNLQQMGGNAFFVKSAGSLKFFARHMFCTLCQKPYFRMNTVVTRSLCPHCQDGGDQVEVPKEATIAISAINRKILPSEARDKARAILDAVRLRSKIDRAYNAEKKRKPRQKHQFDVDGREISAENPFGAALKEARLARGLKMKDIADATDVDISTVSKWESGSHGMSADARDALQSFYEKNPLPESPEETQRPVSIGDDASIVMQEDGIGGVSSATVFDPEGDQLDDLAHEARLTYMTIIGKEAQNFSALSEPTKNVWREAALSVLTKRAEQVS